MTPGIASLTLVAACALAMPNRTGAQTSACLPGSPTASTVRDILVRYVTGTSVGASNARTKLQLPAVADSEVVQVTDSAICAQVAAAQFPNDPGRAVLVFRVGTTRYIVHDRTPASSEFESLAIYDATYHYLTAMTM